MLYCRKLRAVWFSAVVLLLVAAVAYRLTMPGALFLLRFLQPDKDTALGEIVVRDETARIGGRSLRCHLYSKGDRFEKVMLVIHGVHHGGFDEARMVGFAKQLARLGHLVVTPEIEDLKEYTISERAAKDIHLAAKWLIEKSGYLEAGEKLVVLGFSFAGGLVIGAASRPDIRDRVSAVFSFGGHADLDRVMRYLQSGKLPNGDRLAPHVYGQAVIARQFADKLVQPEQVTPLRAVLHDYLKNDFERVKSALHTLAPESRRIVELCLKRDVDTLGRILEASVQSH
jgi:dienelactone hydrolase